MPSIVAVMAYTLNAAANEEYRAELATPAITYISEFYSSTQIRASIDPNLELDNSPKKN